METTPILAFGPLGTQEMLIVLFLALLLFGAKKLPALARSAGQSLSEFRKAQREFQDEMNQKP